MKSILPILLLFTVAVTAQKKVEFPNIGNLVDTNTMQLKTGSHKIIIKKTVGSVASFDTVGLMIMPDTNTFSVNYLPVANAGNDTTFQVGKAGILKGNGSDIDGKIVKWYWKKVTGPTKGRISYSSRQNTTLMDNVAGRYVYRLTVTDDNGGVASDEVNVTFK